MLRGLHMAGKCYAAIDIGSNAVRLLIKKEKTRACLESKKFDKLLLLRVPLRLGFDVFEKGEISDVKTKKLCRLMKSYRHMMHIYDVDEYRACATSAMRDAKNGSDIIKKIYKDTGINIEIINGQEEAQMIYGNHIECTQDREGNFIYVDVGGGSTELNLISNGNLIFSKSFNIGTVRYLSHAVDESIWKNIEKELEKYTKNLEDINIIGSGGNINKLYRLAFEKDIKAESFSVDQLKPLCEDLEGLSIDERMEKYALKSDRADVIVPAARIFLFIAKLTKAKQIYVPTMGLADGIIDKLYEQNHC